MVRVIAVLGLWWAPIPRPVALEPAPAPVRAPRSDGAWKPAKAPAPTPWAQAGARGWRVCHQAEAEAKATKLGGARGGGGLQDDLLWPRRAAQCPHAPEVVALAAETEIVQAADLLAGVENWDSDGAQLAEVAADHARRMRRALRWLQASIDESERRGRLAPPETYYYRAYALTTLGDTPAAQRAIAVAAEHHDAQAHRIQRMAALIHLFQGDLSTALRLAHRAVVDAPADGDRLISRFIYALVLDRVGALHAAAAELSDLQREGGGFSARLAVESVLPVHERLFLRALDHQANERDAHAIRVWDLYLARPEPEGAERVLAARHRAELEPRPELVGGPKH